MPDEKKIAKIERVYLVGTTTRRPGGKIYKYRTWYGYYYEAGKRERVYIGRALPERLAGLIRKKPYTRDPKNYNWPESKRRVEKSSEAA